MPKSDCTDILKALADRSRMRIVKALLAEPHGVNDLAEGLDISQYNVSKHLRILREAGIVDVEPDGTRREYFIVEDFRERLKKEGPVARLRLLQLPVRSVAGLIGGFPLPERVRPNMLNVRILHDCLHETRIVPASRFSARPPPRRPRRSKINGSTTVNLPVAEAAEILRAEQKMDIQVDTQGGSAGGISMLGDGLVQIGMISKHVSDDDRAKYPDGEVSTRSTSARTPWR